MDHLWRCRRGGQLSPSWSHRTSRKLFRAGSPCLRCICYRTTRGNIRPNSQSSSERIYFVPENSASHADILEFDGLSIYIIEIQSSTFAPFGRLDEITWRRRKDRRTINRVYWKCPFIEEDGQDFSRQLWKIDLSNPRSDWISSSTNFWCWRTLKHFNETELSWYRGEFWKLLAVLFLFLPLHTSGEFHFHANRLKLPFSFSLTTR